MASLLHVIGNTVYDVLPDCLFCLNIGWQEIQAAYLIISRHSECAAGGGEDEEIQPASLNVKNVNMRTFGHVWTLESYWTFYFVDTMQCGSCQTFWKAFVES